LIPQIYGRGHNERLIGHFLAGLDKSTREQFKIATKCGIDRSPDESYARTINNTPTISSVAVTNPLSGLALNVDLFYLHRVSNETPVEESMDCLSTLVKEGKINHIGLCEVSASTLHEPIRYILSPRCQNIPCGRVILRIPFCRS
jgi:aryl-alcohol dehydrogenase-like predicted oxidoreductase